MWLLEVALLIIASKTLEAVFIRIGLARLMAYLTLGIAIAVLRHYVGIELSSIAIALANMGIISMLFLAGLESSLRQFIRGMKRTSVVAFGGVLGAMGLSIAVFPLIGRGMVEAFALGVILSATSISVTVKTFEELGLLDTHEAQLIIGAAVVDDVIGLALLSLLHGFSSGSIDILYVVVIPLAAFTVWLGVAFLMSRYGPQLFKAVLKLRLEAGVVSVAFALVLLFAYIASTIGLSSILLAYAFGLGIAGSRYFAKRIEEAMRIISSIFAPLFFIYAGSRIVLEELLSELSTAIGVMLLVIVLAIVSKIVGCYIASRAIGLDRVKSMVIGIGMVPRAEVGLIAATFCIELGVIGHDVFAGILLSISITQFLTPITIKMIYSRMKT